MWVQLPFGTSLPFGEQPVRLLAYIPRTLEDPERLYRTCRHRIYRLSRWHIHIAIDNSGTLSVVDVEMSLQKIWMFNSRAGLALNSMPFTLTPVSILYVLEMRKEKIRKFCSGQYRDCR